MTTASVKLFYSCALLLLFSACTSVRRACPIEVPTEALESAVHDANCEPLFQNKDIIPEEWWLLFNDDQLNEFIHNAFAKNPTIQSTREQILKNIYRADNVKASLYPFFGWSGDVSRQKLSTTGVIPFPSGPPGSDSPTIEVPINLGDTALIPEYFTLYETQLNFKYSFDFWDKHRNTYNAALGKVRANIAEEAHMRLQLSISLTSIYYDLQVDYQRQEILESLVDNRQRYLDLIQRRVQKNIDNMLSLQTAQSNLSDARDLLLEVKAKIAVNEHQLKAYMAGNFNEEIMQKNIRQQPLPRIPLPPDLPLHLIAKRPDITAQLWLIESAGLQIEVAKAGFYPDFNLSALFGFQTIHLSKLLQWPSSDYIVNPAVSLPIFDGGRLVANLRESQINYDLAILEYNNLVINATKEVLNAIAVVRNSWQRLQEYERKLDFQGEIFRLTRLRVQNNLSTGLDELTTEGNMLISKDQEALALKRTLLAILDLIKSIGGGYLNCEE